ncbi:MAG: hypothetical protein H0V44_05905 [Planctomycetes bacterium]|nr:hypothetical protein [Planctomycetota bacterium]
MTRPPPIDPPSGAPPATRARRVVVGTLTVLLILALLPFLVLCLVFSLKLFLAALILLAVGLLLVACACTLWAITWVIASIGRRQLLKKRMQVRTAVTISRSDAGPSAA